MTRRAALRARWPWRSPAGDPVAQSAPQPQSAPALAIRTFAELVALAADRRDIQMKLALERDMRLVRLEDGQLEIALEPTASKVLVNDLSRKLQQWTGRPWVVVISREQGAPTLKSMADAQKAELEIGVRADPLVKAVLERFPGAEIVGVRGQKDIAPELRAVAIRTFRCPTRTASATTGNATSRRSERDMALGDMMGLMKQAAQLQTKMQEMQAELDRIEVEGTAGGGMVTVTLTAKGELKGVKIDDSLMKAEEKEILEDLLVAAHADGAPQGRDGHAGEDEVADRRPAAAAGDEAVLILSAGLRDSLAERGAIITDAEIHRRTRDRAPDPAAGAPAGARPALGAARGAASDQEARAADGAARGRLADRDREDRGLQDLRQHRHRRSLHGVHRCAARPLGDHRGGGRRRRVGAGARRAC